jgi:glycosyltransferase involved in cell wall biosynthesis
MNAPFPTRVVVAIRLLPHYRLTLFENMYARLEKEGVSLRVIYGTPDREHAAKHDLVELPAPIGTKVRSTWLTSDQILYQPVLGEMLKANLVIVINGVSYIPTYLYLMKRKPQAQKLGFWVYHTQQWSEAKSVKEKLRRRLMRRGDWWFAYTNSSRDYLVDNGIQAERITTLDNSIDTRAFRDDLASISEDDLKVFAAAHGIPREAPVGVFCGGLHRRKRLEFLFTALQRIHKQCPEFRLIVIGDGSCREIVLHRAAQDARILYLGPDFGRLKAYSFRLSRVVLCPGLVGLGILDAFVAGLPLVTTELPIHSPEISYLHPGMNGLMTPFEPGAYADAIVDLLGSQEQWQYLHAAALKDSHLYSIEHMAENFSLGILNCLGRQAEQT